MSDGCNGPTGEHQNAQSLGTNKVLLRPLRGSGWSGWARWTWASISQELVVMMQVGGKIVSGSELELSAENCQERASGLIFLEPGQ